MPRISLWKPFKGRDYDYIDAVTRESTEIGGTGIFIHKYIGPVVNDDDNKSSVDSSILADETTIGDVLFMENRERRYDDEVYELRGSYSPENNDFDLTQFGLMLSGEYITIFFHINDMVDRMDRKLMSGDVLEFSHLRDDLLLDEEKDAINRFYVIEDASLAAEGFGPTWWPHFWRVKAKALPDSTEYRDILGTGEDEDDLRNSQSAYDKENQITDRIIQEAEQNVQYDPLFYKADHFYVQDDEDGVPVVAWRGAAGLPPNGKELRGKGDSFPKDMEDGEFFLRTDFEPAALFMKQGKKYIRVSSDNRKIWSPATKRLETYINNDNENTMDNGEVVPEKQPLSKVVRPRVDMDDPDDRLDDDNKDN